MNPYALDTDRGGPRVAVSGGIRGLRVLTIGPRAASG